MDTLTPVVRPQFAQWLREHDLDYSSSAQRLECSRETIRRICLPFGDPGRRFPNKTLLPKIIRLTSGTIDGHDFIEPQRLAMEAR